MYIQDAVDRVKIKRASRARSRALARKCHLNCKPVNKLVRSLLVNNHHFCPSKRSYIEGFFLEDSFANFFCVYVGFFFSKKSSRRAHALIHGSLYARVTRI